VKWRFVDEDTAGNRPALGIAPKVFVPTADESRGLGDSVWRFQIPLQIGKTMGHWYHFAEVGYQWVFKREISDSAYAGAGTLYAFNSHWALGTELFGSVPIDNSDGLAASDHARRRIFVQRSLADQTIHQSHTSQFHAWRTYASRRLLRRYEFLINPFRRILHLPKRAARHYFDRSDSLTQSEQGHDPLW
jgi:hypothetical protein